MTTAKASVAIYVHGVGLDPAHISALLQTAPTFAWRTGDEQQLPGSRTRLRKRGLWALVMDCDAQDINVPLLELLSKIPHGALLLDVAEVEDCYVDVFLTRDGDRKEESLILSPESVAALAETRLPVQITQCGASVPESGGDPSAA